MSLYIQTLIDGLLLGGVYAIVAAGLSLCFGVMRVINWAHGALLMMAMYLTYYLVILAGADFSGADPFRQIRTSGEDRIHW